ncbi:MAG: hypothetical protein WCG14_01960 [Chlamydiia bacterium]
MENGLNHKKTVKKSCKKMAIYFSKSCDPEVSEELLSILFEDSGIEPVSFEKTHEMDNGLLSQEDVLAPFIIQADAEIICPIIPLFDSEVFVLNYRKYYDV